MKDILNSVDWEAMLEPLNMTNAWLFFKSVPLTSVFHYTNPKWRRTYIWPQMLFYWEEKRTNYGKNLLLHFPFLDLSNFKEVNNELRKLTHDLWKDYEKHLVNNVWTKPKPFWQYVNSRIKTRPSIDELCCFDGSTTSSHPEMAKLFNDYFSSVFTHEDTYSIPTLQSDDQPPPIHTFQFTPVSVLNKITNMKSGKSPGPDGCPTQIIKLMAESICIPLSILFNNH